VKQALATNLAEIWFYAALQQAPMLRRSYAEKDGTSHCFARQKLLDFMPVPEQGQIERLWEFQTPERLTFVPLRSVMRLMRAS